MARPFTRAIGIAALLLLAAPGAHAGASAQATRRGLLVDAPATPAAGPRIAAVGVIGDARTEELVRNGFPARLAWRVELWSASGVVNELVGQTSWVVLVRHDPIPDEYVVARLDGARTQVLGRFPAWGDAVRAAETPGVVPLTGRVGGRYYYTATLSVEVMSLSDLREAELWLRGELQPAVRGEKPAGSAVGRFFRSIAARLLGAERRVYEATSPIFVP
jgi:hypothetical protein